MITILKWPAEPKLEERRMVRLPGVAPGHAPWRGAILLLNHNREK